MQLLQNCCKNVRNVFNYNNIIFLYCIWCSNWISLEGAGFLLGCVQLVNTNSIFSSVVSLLHFWFWVFVNGQILKELRDSWICGSEVCRLKEGIYWQVTCSMLVNLRWGRLSICWKLDIFVLFLIKHVEILFLKQWVM